MNVKKKKREKGKEGEKKTDVSFEEINNRGSVFLAAERKPRRESEKGGKKEQRRER